ncbi:hypothetical protein ACQKP0_05970 [Heyndrickxia sp. NPDC080065]
MEKDAVIIQVADKRYVPAGCALENNSKLCEKYITFIARATKL